MATVSAPRWVDAEKLKAPVPGDQPEGESLRYEGTYDKINNARKRDDPHLAQGVWETDLKQADWDQAINVAIEALTRRTKDLQIAAWLMEAWIYRYGFEGALHGLQTLKILCEEFWDTAYPKIEDGDLEARVSPFEWINDKLTIRLKLIPITAPSLQDQQAYTHSDYESASKNENEARKNSEAKEKLGENLNYGRFFASVDHSPPEFYKNLAETLKESRECLAELEAFLDERCGKSSPSLLSFRDTLKTIDRLVAEIRHRPTQRSPEPEPEPEEEDESESFDEDEPEETGELDHRELDSEEEEEAGLTEEMAVETEETPVPATKGKIKSRKEAYRLLEEVARFLEKTEPHSPTPFLIRRAVSWGNMTLDQLLLEIVRDDNDLRFIYELLGIQGNQMPDLDDD